MSNIKILSAVLSFLLLFAISCSNENTTGEDITGEDTGTSIVEDSGTTIPEMWCGKYISDRSNEPTAIVATNSIGIYAYNGGRLLYNTVDVSDSKTTYRGNNTWNYYYDNGEYRDDSTITFSKNEKGQRVLLENPEGIEYTFVHENDMNK